MEIIVQIALLAASAVAFGYGLIKFFKPKTALFKKLITGALGCFLLGRLYELITLLIQKEIPSFFNIGMLATIGGFMFIFSASYAQMDGLVDDKTKGLSKYRFISAIAPVGIILLYIPVASSSVSLVSKITTLVLFLIIGCAAYYNLKHLIIKDVSFGIIDSIRMYNLAALITALFTSVQIMADKLELKTVWLISSILVAIMYIVTIVALDKGSKKWTI